MAIQEVYSEIQLRIDSTTNWNYVNPVLPIKQAGFEYTGSFGSLTPVGMKVGDGVRTWDDLPYWFTVADAKNILIKAGSDISGSGEIDVSGDSIPSGKDLLAVYIDGHPAYAQLFYDYTDEIVTGFDTGTAGDAIIIMKFI